MECFLYVKSIWSNVSFKAHVSLSILYLDDLSIGVGEVLKFSIITVFLSISPFVSVHIYVILRCFCVGCIFTTVVYASWIDPLIIMLCPSLYIVTVFKVFCLM